MSVYYKNKRDFFEIIEIFISNKINLGYILRINFQTTNLRRSVIISSIGFNYFVEMGEFVVHLARLRFLLHFHAYLNSLQLPLQQN